MSRVDIVIFGATGYTGKFVVRELACAYLNENFTWAVAGRSQDKLKKMLKSITDEKSLIFYSLNFIFFSKNVRVSCKAAAHFSS